MNLPENTTLPFFAYGVFKADQLAFNRIQEFVQTRSDGSVSGRLRERDGLPLLEPRDHGTVKGHLFWFGETTHNDAYQRIIDIEPDRQYQWSVLTVESDEKEFAANVLEGINLLKGSEQLKEPEWNGADDALFTSALQVVEETLEANEKFSSDLKPLFRLQMAYLLLWSSIERYVSLKYHLGDKVSAKVNMLAEEDAFRDAVSALVKRRHKLFRADRPTQHIVLNASNPKKALGYYYQIRSNITHRGKAVMNDHNTVRESLRELLAIFKVVLERAFPFRPSAGYE
jgi:hypothetical protein